LLGQEQAFNFLVAFIKKSHFFFLAISFVFEVLAEVEEERPRKNLRTVRVGIEKV